MVYMEYSSVASQNTMHGKLITTTLWFNDENLHAQNAQLSWLVWFNKLTFDNLHAKAGEQNFIYHVGSMKYIMHAHRVQFHWPL